MVGPPPEAERRATMRRLRYGFVALVAVSAAVIAVNGGASLATVALIGVAGAVVGVVLAWIVFPDEADLPSRVRARRQNGGSLTRWEDGRGRDTKVREEGGDHDRDAPERRRRR